MTQKAWLDEELIEMIYGDPAPGCEIIAKQPRGSGRWYAYYTLIFKYDDQLWGVDYASGLTEMQEIEPFEFTKPSVYAVEPYQVTTTHYRKVEINESVQPIAAVQQHPTVDKTSKKSRAKVNGSNS
jgi:hypothetical protein